ncbi:transposase [Hymenobacter sp. BT507]|uniref:Transposase n=1 Tax=Hymenobacter citatus TaxID=2763506 RepID=A0ABR7MFV2_9BACT|nr:transposase [Hymenobacter citatus]MBC6609953.1 transposase [Hymenobacter citatus]
MNGRKRQILTDSAGRIWAAHVHAAHQHDSGCGPALLPHRSWWMARLTTVLTDQAYRGRFAQHVAGLGLCQELASRPPSATGFVPIAKRWVVERTFAWLTSFRRLALDYEFTPASHSTWLLVANLTICLNRLTQIPQHALIHRYNVLHVALPGYSAAMWRSCFYLWK